MRWIAAFVLAGAAASARVAEGGEAPKAVPRVAFIGLHGGIFAQLKALEKEAGLRLDYITDEEVASGKIEFSAYAVVFLQHLRGEDRQTYRRLFAEAKAKNPKLRILTFAPNNVDMFRDLGGGKLVEHDPRIAAYYSPSKENLRRLLAATRVQLLGLPGQVEPPEKVSALAGLYHPDHQGLFKSVAELIAWSERRGKDTKGSPRALVTVHSFHLQFQQPRVVDALVREFERQGILAAGVIDTTGRGSAKGPSPYEAMVAEFRPGAIVHTCHSTDSVDFRKQINVPHLHSLFFRKQSIAEWYADAGATLGGNDLTFQVGAQEFLGPIEPLTGCGTLRGGGSDEGFTPIDERIQHLVRRAAAWIRLGRKPAAEKRVAIVYYDREMGKSELMRGSTTGMFLNAPRSLVNVLKAMKEAGYAISAVPQDESELIGWMMDRGRQIGIWAPGELDRIVQKGNPALVPVKTYQDWFEKRVPESARKEVIEKWGPPPGRFLVWEDAKGEKFIVIPKIDLGNVVLLPQPLRGEAHDKTLLHDKLVPPPHNYLATYFWLEEGFHADAMVHFGTHGSEFLLPGGPVALRDKDWPDIVAGSLPNINPWIIDNLGEALPAKRRAYAVLISYLTPPMVNAGLADELLNLHGDIEKWQTLEAGALKEKFRGSITQQVREAKLDKDLHLDLSAERLLTPEEVERAATYLHDVYNETTPISLHVLGQPPREDLLVPYLVTCLRKKFIADLGAVLPVPPSESKFRGDREKFLRKKAEEIVGLMVRRGLTPTEAVRATVGAAAPAVLPDAVEKSLQSAIDLNQRFQKTGQEVDNLLAALAGKFVPPGPGNSPIRDPASVPTGRNLYVLNPDEVPSRPSWEIGKGLVDQMLPEYLKRNGSYPEKVAFDLSSFATFRDYGVMESQILYLLGVEPVWDEKNLVNDVRIIPAATLKRPRIDVFISALSYYRDNLPTRMILLDKAVRLVAELDESNNGVRTGTLAVRDKLIQRGIPKEKAEVLASARIFGYPQNQFGSASYYYLVERSGDWDTRDELMDAYLSHVTNVYTRDLWGEPAREAFEEAIQGTTVVLRSWSDHMTSPLANKYTWFRGGSLALAVKHLTGKEPEFLLSDVRDPDQTRMVDSQDALRQEFRVRLFNRKWIEGMKNEGYAGADQIAHMASNVFGWKVMREGSVSDDVWEEIKSVYVDDKYKLSICEWFEAQNPFAFQDVLEVMLETARKGYWKAHERTVRQLSELYAQSVVRHGEGGGLRGGGNTKLETYVGRTLTAPGDAQLAALAAQYRAKARELSTRSHPPASAPSAVDRRMADSEAKKGEPRERPAKATEQVKGKHLEPSARAEPAEPRSRFPWPYAGILAAVLVLLLYGFVRRSGALRACPPDGGGGSSQR